MDIWSSVLLGLDTALSPSTLMYCFIGVFLGTFVGVLPGIGALVTIALLLPITYHLDPTQALIMLAGVYYGAYYGGSTASILLRLPGTPAAAVVCLDGYPMAQQGRAGVALFMTTIASFVGATIGILVLMLASPMLAKLALQFGPAEYFGVMALGLVAAATISGGNPIKGMAMVVVGLVLGLVGIDLQSGMERYTYGIIELNDGIGIVAIAMGVFGVAEVISKINNVEAGHVHSGGISMRSMLPTREDWKRSAMPLLRGSGIGSFFGALPGAGPTISSFLAYAIEQRVSRRPEAFGHGAIEGVTAPEAANNAGIQTAFVPTLTLGIPGDVVMAVLMAAMILHGIPPGPQLVLEQPDLFWGLIMSFWVGNIMLLVLNIPLIGLWVRILTIPYSVLYPGVLMLVCIGVFSVTNNTFQIWQVIAFGAFGYVLMLLRFPVAPMLLGLVLGKLLEEYFRRALVLSRGDLMVFVERPISAVFLALTLSLIVWGIWEAIRRKLRPPPTAGRRALTSND